MSKLKICGLTKLDDALFCDRLKVDFLGFIFYEESSRYVDPTAASLIVERLKHSKPIGVFVGQSADKVVKTAKSLGLWGVQIYEDLAIPEDAGLQIIRGLRVKDREDVDIAEYFLKQYPNDYVLLDTYHKDKMGGTGQMFDWSILPPDLTRVFLAGGIHAGNVLDASLKSPFAIDLVTGTEESPGKKDFEKVKQIVGLVRS